MNEDNSTSPPADLGEIVLSQGGLEASSEKGLASIGNESSEASVFVSYYLASRASIRAYLYTILKDSAACEDCMQEAVMVLWEKRQADWDLEDFRKLAYTCARFKALSWLKKNKPSSHLHLSPKLSEKISVLVTTTETSSDSVKGDRINALRECIDTLPPKQREIIEARYANKHAEALEVVSIKQSLSMAAVYKQLERVRTRLRKCINFKLDRTP